MQPGVKLASSLVLTVNVNWIDLLTLIKIGDKLFNMSIHDNCISWHFFHVTIHSKPHFK